MKLVYIIIVVATVQLCSSFPLEMAGQLLEIDGNGQLYDETGFLYLLYLALKDIFLPTLKVFSLWKIVERVIVINSLK